MKHHKFQELDEGGNDATFICISFVACIDDSNNK